MSVRADAEGRNRAPLAALRNFVRQRVPLERCELCGAGLASAHPHLVQLEQRHLVCACEPCALLFVGVGSPLYKRVPRTITRLAGFSLTDQQWDALMVPIDLAFFMHRTAAGRVVAVYPSPAGPTESLLELGAWDELAAGDERLRTLEPDVEALLVNRVRQRVETPAFGCFIVPIDECYKLVGLIRRSWHGLSGGVQVWREIAEFFASLDARAITRERQRA